MSSTRNGDVVLADFTFRTTDKIRYSDTDRQGHVNNAVFAKFLETGRVEILYDPAFPLLVPDSAFVIARLVLDFRAEMAWPGTVQIGTRIASIGRSSLTLEQALFQDARCVASAETIIVLIDTSTRRSKPFSAAAVERLGSFLDAAKMAAP